MGALRDSRGWKANANGPGMKELGSNKDGILWLEWRL
jgi:hypothetical protein